MRIVSITASKKEQDFAQKAVEYMSTHPSSYTYADGYPKAGELLAIRWNPFTVLVIMLDEVHEPACYRTYDFIRKDLPPLKGEVDIEVVKSENILSVEDIDKINLNSQRKI